MDNELNAKELTVEEAEASLNKSPTPSLEEAVAEKVMGKVTEWPSISAKEEDLEPHGEADGIPGPTEAPKIEIAKPNPPSRAQVAPQPQPQKNIPTDAQMEYLCRKICKIKGHNIQGVELHTTQRTKDGTPFISANTIVICVCCGASLAQIRG